MVLTPPFDASLGIAHPNHATALFGIALDTNAVLARPNDAAAASGTPKHPITIRRIGTVNARDSWVCRSVRRRRISSNMAREGEIYQEKNENEAEANRCLHCLTPVLHVIRT
jgi:hypothetical protein